MTIAYDYKKRTGATLPTRRPQKAAHKVLKQIPLQPSLPQRGYTNRTLHVNLDTLRDHREGGHRADEGHLHRRPGLRPVVPLERHHAETKWNDPENDIVIAPGRWRQHPVPRLGQVAGRDALAADRHPIDSNVGGYFGPLPQVRGFDALEIQGKAESDVIVLSSTARRARSPSRRRPRRTWTPHRGRAVHAPVRRRREGLAERVGGVRRQGRRAQPASAASTSPGTTRARARPGSSRPGAAASARSSATRRSRRWSCTAPVKGDMNHPADFQRTTKVGRKLHKEIHDFDDQQCNMRRAGHGPPGRGDGRLRSAAGAQLPVRQAPGHRQDRTRPSGTSASRRASPTAAGTAAPWPARRAPTASR